MNTLLWWGLSPLIMLFSRWNVSCTQKGIGWWIYLTLIWTNCLKSSLGKTLSTAAWYMYGAFLSERSKHLSKKTPQVWPIRFSEHVIFSKVLLEKCNVDEMLENGHLHVFKFPNLTKIFANIFTPNHHYHDHHHGHHHHHQCCAL